MSKERIEDAIKDANASIEYYKEMIELSELKIKSLLKELNNEE